MGIPAVAGLAPGVLAFPEGEELVVNGDEGTIEPRPGTARLEQIKSTRKQREAARAESLKMANGKAITLDGVPNARLFASCCP
jgi:phosphoenolpyruvate-protein kinase (PTS system EI component)